MTQLINPIQSNEIISIDYDTNTLDIILGSGQPLSTTSGLEIVLGTGILNSSGALTFDTTIDYNLTGNITISTLALTNVLNAEYINLGTGILNSSGALAFDTTIDYSFSGSITIESLTVTNFTIGNLTANGNILANSNGGYVSAYNEQILMFTGTSAVNGNGGAGGMSIQGRPRIGDWGEWLTIGEPNGTNNGNIIQISSGGIFTGHSSGIATAPTIRNTLDDGNGNVKLSEILSVNTINAFSGSTVTVADELMLSSIGLISGSSALTINGNLTVKGQVLSNYFTVVYNGLNNNTAIYLAAGTYIATSNLTFNNYGNSGEAVLYYGTGTSSGSLQPIIGVNLQFAVYAIETAGTFNWGTADGKSSNVLMFFVG